MDLSDPARHPLTYLRLTAKAGDNKSFSLDIHSGLNGAIRFGSYLSPAFPARGKLPKRAAGGVVK